MKMFYCLLLLICPLRNCAQPPVPLSVGDKVPDIIFKEILNAPYTGTGLASSTDKLLLLDFWATWCASCVREFPKLDTLQLAFKDRLTILLVNEPNSGDDIKKVNAFFEKKTNPGGKKFALPVIFSSEQLTKWFPHLTIPHTVWIYRNKVIAITGAAEVNAANIQSVLENKVIAFEIKEDQMDFDFHKPLLENDNGGTASSLLYKSVFTKFLNGAGGATGQLLSPDSLQLRKFYINKPVLSLYSSAFPNLETNRRILDDELYGLLLNDTQNLKWKTDHYFCYEQTLASGTNPEKQQRLMQLDLDRQFELFSRIEKRLIKCYVLKLKNAGLLNTPAPGAVKGGLQKDDNGYWIIKNHGISALVIALNRQSVGKPFFPVVLDETGYALPVNIKLEVKDIHDLDALQKILPSCGLELIIADREVDMLVISKQFSPKQTH